MISRKKITILQHKKDFPLKRNTHLIHGIMHFWIKMGYQVEVLKGISGSKPKTDLLLPHIDLTRVPEEYIDYISDVPHVLNRRVTDISKRLISSNLLSRNDVYDHPVIVKTDRNCGGLPELKTSIPSRIKRKLRHLTGMKSSRFINKSSLDNYFLFPSLQKVPAEVWSNHNLVVEKFIPERQEHYYSIRMCIFFGNVVLNRRLLSLSPIIKGHPEFSEPLDPPEELLEIRNRLGFDYGKFDYVIHQGKVHIIDANKTPGNPDVPETSTTMCSKLAQGILNFF